jgi:hypothetical protein
MQITANQPLTYTSNRQVPAAASSSEGQTFATEMAKQTARSDVADFVSGRIGLDLNAQGIPSRVVYLDDDGSVLTTSSFNARRILENADRFGIDLQDLNELGAQLDSAGVGYKPYELYPGTGSDHGIDFNDLANGGLGTAYDWRKDDNAALKGPGAEAKAAEAKAFADSKGLQLNPDVTQEKGLDPNKLQAQVDSSGSARPYVMVDGDTAAWYASYSDATAAARQYGGSILTPSPNTDMSSSAIQGNAAEQPATNTTDTQALLQQVQRLLSSGSNAERSLLLSGLTAALDKLG